MVLNFETKFIEWDEAFAAMHHNNSSKSPSTIATNMLLDTLDDDLEANDSIFMADMQDLSSPEINYQKNDLNPNGNKTKNPILSL